MANTMTYAKAFETVIALDNAETLLGKEVYDKMVDALKREKSNAEKKKAKASKVNDALVNVVLSALDSVPSTATDVLTRVNAILSADGKETISVQKLSPILTKSGATRTMNGKTPLFSAPSDDGADDGEDVE